MKQLLLLDSGLDGDDTDGHIDTLARFVRDDVVLAAVEPRPDFPNHRVLTRNAEFLRTAKLHDGRTLEVIPLPSPDPIRPRNWREKILPATYANFLLLNNAVLLPTYAQKKADDTAAGILRALFPDREIIGIDCSEILLEGGALHCLSQQLPARRPTA